MQDRHKYYPESGWYWKWIIALLIFIVGGVMAVNLALAGDYYRNYSPMQGVLQGQAYEEGLARAEREGQQERGYFSSPPPPVRQSPRVMNPYSPYLGLPQNQAEGQVLQQLLDMQQEINELKQRDRRGR